MSEPSTEKRLVPISAGQRAILSEIADHCDDLIESQDAVLRSIVTAYEQGITCCLDPFHTDQEERATTVQGDIEPPPDSLGNRQFNPAPNDLHGDHSERPEPRRWTRWECERCGWNSWEDTPHHCVDWEVVDQARPVEVVEARELERVKAERDKAIRYEANSAAHLAEALVRVEVLTAALRKIADEPWPDQRTEHAIRDCARAALGPPHQVDGEGGAGRS